MQKESRMLIPEKLMTFLKVNQVPFEVIHHFEAFTAPELAELEHVKGRFHAKVVLVHCPDRHWMLVLPTDHRVDLEKLQDKGPVAIDSEPELEALFNDCALGKMPPFGKLYGLPTLIDRSMTDQEMIVFEAGTHTDAIKMSMADYLRLAEGEIGDFSMKFYPMRAA